jgi:CO/xanthine dehydrogenase Mo-binding subunit/aerobic-type carbon monoxide dehydrogenase small subunit (CoxS/CutS family)
MTELSRRAFLEVSAGGLAASTVVPVTEAIAQQAAAAATTAPRTTLRVTVNGRAREVQVEDRLTLAEFLRDELQLTGTKIGCDRGECGACTVLLDGAPIYACSYLAVWADGRSVETVEGLASGDGLHPLQQAFIDHDAPQCGFCTSGQLMTAKALLASTARPSADQVRSALAGNLCRCSNYNHYVEAVVAAGAASAPRSRSAPNATPTPNVGTPTPRIDAKSRVSGTARYSSDVRLPGMLHARVLRSPHPHAKISRIQTGRALALPGVKAVITHENCRVTWSSGDTRNTRFLFNNPVRFAGDAVAAVAATSAALADEALRLIDVDYEPLPFVLDAEAAIAADAPHLWPGGNLSPNPAGKPEPETYRRGNVAEGFQASDRVFEGHYTSAHVNNAQLERRVSLAAWDGDKLTVYASTQGISNCQRDLAADLKVPSQNVRVVCEFMGGGFGNKNQCHDFDLMAAVLAKQANAPVRLELTRKEDYVAVHGRWPTSQYYKIGVTRDGQLRAIQMRGYSGMGPYRKGSGGIAGTELYECPHVETLVHPIYTNTAVAANYRAPDYPQGVFGVESMMDEIADALGIDPLEFRLRNATKRYHDELPYTSNGLEACLRRGADAFGWKQRWRAPGSDAGVLKRGVGMAMGSFHSRVGRSSAVIKLDSSGRYAVHVGVTDVGSGAKTTMALIAADALKVPLDRITIVSGDTDRCPYSVGESGSRTTNFTGFAVIEAARDLERQIKEKGLPQGSDVLIGSATPEPRIEGAARYAFAAHFAEVEVDTELGAVRIRKYLAAHDSGRIVNPLTALSQVKGGVTMGIGMALHEELHYDPKTGIPLNPGYYGARVMTHQDAPDVDVLFVETEDAFGPFGAKTLGEPPMIPSVAAVANAFFNATGRRIKDLPMSRERVLDVLT